MRQPGLAVSFLYFDDYRCFLRVVSLGIVGLVAEIVTAFFIFPRGIDKAAVIRQHNVPFYRVGCDGIAGHIPVRITG